MATDFFEQLANQAIPPVPESFDRQLNERVNRALLWQQIIDFATRAVPYAIGQFGLAVWGAVCITLAGTTGSDKGKKSS